MMESGKSDELPQGWTWAELNDFADIVLGQSPPHQLIMKNVWVFPFIKGN